MLQKIGDLPYCNHPEHFFPKDQPLADGVWENTCPKCGHKTIKTIDNSKPFKLPEDTDKAWPFKPQYPFAPQDIWLREIQGMRNGWDRHEY